MENRHLFGLALVTSALALLLRWAPIWGQSQIGVDGIPRWAHLETTQQTLFATDAVLAILSWSLVVALAVGTGIFAGRRMPISLFYREALTMITIGTGLGVLIVWGLIGPSYAIGFPELAGVGVVVPILDLLRWAVEIGILVIVSMFGGASLGEFSDDTRQSE